MLHNYAVKFGKTPLGSTMFQNFEGGLSLFLGVYKRRKLQLFDHRFTAKKAFHVKMGSAQTKHKL